MVLTNIRLFYGEMFQAEKKVADYILEHPEEVINITMAELAKKSETSDATIIRMCKHIGYTGFYQMKIDLAGNLPVRKDQRREDKPGNVIGFFDRMSENIEDVAKNINKEILQKCVNLISNARMVYTVGWGNTGEISADLAHRLTRVGIRSFETNIPEYSIRSIALAGPEDVLVAISHSGSSLPIIQSIEMAKEIGMKTIVITNVSTSPAAETADYTLFTDAKNQLFDDIGGASHILELLIVDTLLYFLKANEKLLPRSNKAEFFSSQYKI